MARSQSIASSSELPGLDGRRLWNKDYILCCTANFLSFFAFYILLPVLPLYLNDMLCATKSQIGTVLSLYALACLLVRPFSGFMVDRYPRKDVLVISFASFAAVFGLYFVALTIATFGIVRAVHGVTYGAVSVSNSTVAIDVMPPAKRGTGIAYYGVANNMAMCIGPSVSMYMYQHGVGFIYIFIIALSAAILGFAAVSMVKTPDKLRVVDSRKLSFDRFWLSKAWRQSLNLIFVAFSYGLMTTFLAIYGKEEIGMADASGTFFLLLAIGIIVSRVIASRNINTGRVTINIVCGVAILAFGYALFALWRVPAGYFLSALIIGFGQGMVAPAYQTVFINLAPNSQRGTANSTYLTSWDVGAAIGIFAGGYIVDLLGYLWAFLSCSATCIVALALFMAVSGPHFNRAKLR